MTRPSLLATGRSRLRAHPTGFAVALLAVVSYVPALLSSPGRMPADTKLYLYLDPGGLVGRAASTFEPDQLAGWVPHQQITYLWPSGPWFWLGDAIGLPDWIAHRLWIATIMFAAGSGVLWTARRLRLPVAGALAAGLLYQLSPYLLPYISRTSLLLLPWAGLGWIVGLTIRATARAADGPVGDGGRRARLLPWREPALIALVVATVGSANATAIALVAPAPVLWLVHAAWARTIRWRAALGIALRAGAACLVVSVWWISMLLVQSRHGAPVLAYSETLTDVSRNSTGSEVLRSLGYWLFYVRDAYGPTTSASFDYLVGTRLIAVSYAVSLVGLAGIALTSSTFRRFAALLVATGAVLAVGVHPIGSPSPLMSLIANDDESGIALALRSSTRALPLLVLGFALGAGSLVAAIPNDRRSFARAGLPRVRTVGAAAVALLALANLPSLWQFELVDEIIDRDESPPAEWTDAATTLDASDGGGRVLQLPGAEFGAFRWGYTVDQPLVGLSDRRLVTRDLLPLGSAGAMDLLFALDDRFQEGTVEPASLAPVARLLGTDSVWLANDAEFERFRTPRPEIVDDLLTSTDVAGLGPAQAFGERFVSEPTVPMVDPTSLADDRVGTPIEPVVLVPVDEPVGVARAKDEVVVLAGSGDGVVDAAAAGLLSGHELVLYGAPPSGADVDPATPLIVTDSNRDRARHWRGSQDVHGHTEPGGPDDDVLVATNADQRLAVFDSDDPAIQTIAVQDGPVTAIASAYGEPFAYLPEHRAVMAIDGNPSTAWLVGGHGDPVGERIEFVVGGGGATEMTVHQPDPAPGGRRIAAVRVGVGSDDPFDVELTDESTSTDGQPIDLGDPGGGDVSIEITAVTGGDPARAASRSAVGFTEVDFGHPPTVELIRPPQAALDAATGPLALVFTRLRVDPFDRWRADPEPELARVFELPSTRTFDAALTVRFDRRAGHATLTRLLREVPAVVAGEHLAGAPRHSAGAAFDGDPATAWVTPFDAAIGAELWARPASDAIVSSFRITQPDGDYARITSVNVDIGPSATFDLAVPPPDGDGVSTIELPEPVEPDRWRITITGTDGAATVDRRFGDVVGLPAAVAEVTAPGLPLVPLDESRPVPARPTCRPDLLEIDGREVLVSFQTTVGELLDGDPIAAEICGPPLELGPGEHRIVSTGRSEGITVDRLVLSDRTPAPAPPSPVDVVVERDDPRRRTVTVTGCDDGCWLVHGEGYNRAWEARVGGESLGPPTMVDGGFNGWLLPPSDRPVTVDITWTAQRLVTAGLVLSGVGVLCCGAVVALTRGRRRPELAVATPSMRRPGRPDRTRTTATAAIALVVTSAVLIAPIWGVVAAVVGAVAVAVDRTLDRPAAHRSYELVGMLGATAVALAAIVITRRNRPLPNAGWTESYEQLNGLALFSVLCLAVGAASWSAQRRSRSDDR